MKTSKQFIAMALIAILALAFTACPNPTKVTKTVKVTFPAYTMNQTNMSFAPTYTPVDGWGAFSETDITYTVTVTCDDVNKTYDSSNGFTAKISDGYKNFTTPAFTQIFKQNGVEVGRQVIKVTVVGSNFSVLKDADDTTLDPQAIPPITLHLVKYE